MSKIRLAQHGGYIFVVRTALTPAQVGIVQDSFRRIGPQAAEASRIFYDELFRISPELRELFPDDMSAHKTKFVQMLAGIVRSLDQIAAVSEEIVDLGRRHMSYDVEDGHYAAVGEALLWTINRLLGAEFTPEAREAWASAYDMIARVMQEASEVTHTTESFYAAIIRSVMTSQYGMSVMQGSKTTAPLTREIERGQIVRFP
jgi:hemoglobin-like flavoprotein